MPLNVFRLSSLAGACNRTRILRNGLFFATAVLLLTHASPAQNSKASKIPDGDNHALEFVQKIGVGWQTGRSGWMSFVSFGPDGTMVASDGASNPTDVSQNLTLWSFPEGRFIKSIPVRPTAISSDWKYYASNSAVGELESGKTILSSGQPGDDIYAVHAFSPDSHYVAEFVSGQDIHDAHIHVLELASGKEVSVFGKQTPLSIAISPDGKTLASGYWDVVTLWNMFTGERLAVLKGFGRYVQALSFSRDGKFIAAGTDFGGLQIWDVGSRTRIQSLDIGGGQVSKPAFSPDGRLVAVGIYGTGAVWLIDGGTGKILDHQKISDIGCGSVAFSPDGSFLITPSTGGLIRWPYDRGGTIRVFKVRAP